MQGSDKEVICGFFVSSINEWKISQPRVLVLSRSAYYRVTYSHKYGRIDHYHKTPLNKLRVFEKTATGLKVFLTEQDGNSSIGKTVTGWFGKKKDKDEFEHAREYLPAPPTAGASVDLVVDVMAACFHKVAELCSDCAPTGAGFPVPAIITTDGRKKILADRKEAQRLEAERVEREAASEELRAAMAAASESRAFDGLAKPMRRCKRAVDVDGALLDEAEKLNVALQEEKKERELAERLERERIEREAASEELSNAMKAAEESRDGTVLAKPIKRAKRAVDFPAEALGTAEALVVTLAEEKKERERQEAEDARLEKERIEREEAGKELDGAIEGAKAGRDAAPPAPAEGGSTAMDKAARLLEKPIKRAKRAVDFPAEALGAAEALKVELEGLKKERETAERLERERIEREGATEELTGAIAACNESRDPTAVVKAVKRAKKAVEVSAELIAEGEALKAACDEEKRAAAQAAKEEAAAAKAAAKAEADAAAAAKAQEAAAAKAEAAAKAAEAASAAAAGAAATASAPADAEEVDVS